ncbi:hypothetical protein IWW34DRAFT_717452 [Fusarium oxysporum f. sp. albedinis]|nr:hypothetical protein IWW34DRAFT_717452 [Fusarium oxysporum f. sp. albedinis]
MSSRYRVPAESSAQKVQALSVVGHYFPKDRQKAQRSTKRPELKAPDAAFFFAVFFTCLLLVVFVTTHLLSLVPTKVPRRWLAPVNEALASISLLQLPMTVSTTAPVSIWHPIYPCRHSRNCKFICSIANRI